MIVTVTLNAAIDRRYEIENLTEGQVMRVKTCTATPGGKGLNVSQPLAFLKADVLATGFVGGFAGKFIVNEIEKLGIKVDFYHMEAESRCCINIWDEGKHIQTEFLEPGFVVEAEHRDNFLLKFEEVIKEAKVITMSGSAPTGIENGYYGELVKIAKKQNKKVILDTSGAYLEEGIKSSPTLIKPNIDEIRMLTGKSCTDITEIIDAAIHLQKGGISNVVVSLGSEGSVLASEEGVFRAIVPKINAINTVGCGDAMIAGFALGMDQNLSAKEMLRLASAVSAASAMQARTGYLVPSDKEELLNKIQISKI